MLRFVGPHSFSLCSNADDYVLCRNCLLIASPSLVISFVTKEAVRRVSCCPSSTRRQRICPAACTVLEQAARLFFTDDVSLQVFMEHLKRLVRRSLLGSS